MILQNLRPPRLLYVRDVSARPRPAALLACLLGAIALAAPAEAAKQISVQGRVTTDKGEPLADWPVELVATQRYMEFRSFSSGGKVAEVASTRTDARGYYTFDLERQRGWHYLFLRYADPKRTDNVRFLRPEVVEITADVRRGRLAEVPLTVRYHPDWSEVQRRLAEAGGEGTPRGRVLRALGLPEKRVQTESGDEEWWYFTHGIMYTFRGDEGIGMHRFEPVPPPPDGEASGR